MKLVSIVVAAGLVIACGSSSSGPSASTGQMGTTCSCPGATDAGDYLCAGKMYTTCAASLYCIDGVCTTFCQLDAGTCPSGYVCKQTPHSNATIYCAPQ